MKIIFKIMKKLILAFLMLYMYNILAQSLNINIPINIYTLIFLFVLGFPGLLSLIVIMLI